MQQYSCTALLHRFPAAPVAVVGLGLGMAYTAQVFPACYTYLNSEMPTRTKLFSMSFLHKTSCP